MKRLVGGGDKHSICDAISRNDCVCSIRRYERFVQKAFARINSNVGRRDGLKISGELCDIRDAIHCAIRGPEETKQKAGSVAAL